MTDRPVVAWLGTGLMGAPMAARLLTHGYRVRVWNRTLAKAQALASQGAEVADTPAAAVAGSDLVFTTLSDFDASGAVLTGLDLGGRTVIQMATIAPDQSRCLATQVAAAGGAYLEAPVLGSIPEAGAGTLIIMAGGPEEVFKRVRDHLEILGSNPRLIGETGKAAALKLALNQLIASLTVTFATSLAFVGHSGVEVATFMDILRQSALYAPTFDKKLARMQTHDYRNPNFPTEHLVKDIGLFLHSAAGIGTGPLEAVRRLYQEAVSSHRFEDYSCVFETVRTGRGRDDE